MVKERYFYYLFMINALINIVNFVPRGLINSSFGGAMMAIVIAIPLGVLMTFLFIKGMNKFPSQSLPAVFNAHFPKAISATALLLYASLWFTAGLITLISFVEVTLRYVSVDVEPTMIMLLFLAVVCLCMRINSESLLYGLEVLLCINFPLIVYILLKAILHPYFSWDAVADIFTHSIALPSYRDIATATFIFSGYINMAVFNQVFKPLQLKYLWLIGVLGALILLTTFLIPIGFLGTINVYRHVYPWFSTADALRTQNFIIERVLFIFYFSYLTLSLNSAIIHWHVALNLIKGAFTSRNKKETRSKSDWWIMGIFSAISLFVQTINQFKLDQLGLMFLSVRLCGEAALILSVFIAYRRSRRKTA
ncbi:GerAB/ArcD/ProY family transporter [Paenibacillus physcomitrellae]|uniref:Spore germination protein n=1 Tax=Paenibacillus physcomitrellae TaxID=1619311 RepID=A0ABQ1FST5_9BACL|nr:GerAB/ArcD/ProY family transporter [Paenibacillus physcomitrellae]GGA29651.1 hypothetical protein GCM10010917_13360 [Paenibacillus physcomitrellae]